MPCDLPVDLTCCPDWDDDEVYTEAQRDLALYQAQQTLRMLTGYRTANCPVTIRPCRQDCPSIPTWMVFPVQNSGTWAGAVPGPRIVDGQWFNMGCGCGATDCDCATTCEVRLPGEVASVQDVLLDGASLDSTAYRIDNGNRLVRVDGDCWPRCQNMSAAVSEDGTFAVTFTPGAPLDIWGQAALGALACEMIRALCGDRKCRLPPNVTQVIRQGVTLNLAQNPFPGGLTGIREVDGYVTRLNPYGLKAPSVVWSPDINRGRVTTWSAS